MPKVSIIVPIYKVENYLNQCLDSIIKQTLTDIEIILIDEGDEDRCREIIDDYQAHDSRIIALHDKHGGYGNSVNAGIEIATGDYIGFVESDDFIEPEMFELLYNKAIETGADVVKSSFYTYNGKDYYGPFVKELNEKLPSDRIFSPLTYAEIFTIHPSIWAGIYKTDWLQNSGIRFLPKGEYLDVLFRFQVLLSTNKVAWVNTPLYHWRSNNPNSTNSKWNYEGVLFIWGKVHDFFKDKPIEWDRIAPLIIGKEYNNLFMRANSTNYSPDQLLTITKFRHYYNDEHILNSIYLDDNQKNYLMSFEEHLSTDNNETVETVQVWKRKINYIADVMDNARRKSLVCIATLLSVLTLFVVKYNLYDTIIDVQKYNIITDVLSPISFATFVSCLIYFTILIAIRLIQDVMNIIRLIR